MTEYTHTLIPDRSDLIPTPDQIVRFLLALSEAGALPLEPSITIGLQSGQTRSGINPITGQPISYSRRAIQRISSIAELPNTIQGHSDYNIAISGNGPPYTPAFSFDFDNHYQFQVNVCHRPALVSTSDPHDITLSGTDVPEFDVPCGPEYSIGVYQHPHTLSRILVPGTGCSHFWIEFEFGNSLVPVIDDDLQIMDPQIVDVARFFFNTDFVQGCRWSV